jgi:hypothetical protein
MSCWLYEENGEISRKSGTIWKIYWELEDLPRSAQGKNMKKPLLRIAQGIRRLRMLEVSDPILRRKTAHSLMGMILKVEDGNRTLMIFNILYILYILYYIYILYIYYIIYIYIIYILYIYMYIIILTFWTSYFDVSKDMVNILEISEKCPLEPRPGRWHTQTDLETIRFRPGQAKQGRNLAKRINKVSNISILMNTEIVGIYNSQICQTNVLPQCLSSKYRFWNQTLNSHSSAPILCRKLSDLWYLHWNCWYKKQFSEMQLICHRSSKVLSTGWQFALGGAALWI